MTPTAPKGFKELTRKTFKARPGATLDNWLKEVVAKYAKAYANEGAKIYWGFDGKDFVTDGGDEVKGTWDWVNFDDLESDVVAIVYGKDF